MKINFGTRYVRFWPKADKAIKGILEEIRQAAEPMGEGDCKRLK